LHLVDKTGTRLINEGSMEVKSGPLEVEGPPALLQNEATLKVDAGQKLECDVSHCPAVLDNAPEGTIEVVGSAAHPSEVAVNAEHIGIADDGAIKVGSGLFLTVTDGAELGLADKAELAGPGTVRIGPQGIAAPVGTTTLSGGVDVALNGEGAEIHGGTVNGEGTLFGGILTAASSREGTLHWLDGGVEGALALEGSLQTVVGGGGEHRVDPEIRDTAMPTRNPTLLTLGSPTEIDEVPIAIGSETSGDAVAVNGPLTLNGTSGNEAGFARVDTDADGAIVDPAGTITAQGRDAVEAPLTLLGKLTVPSAAMLKIPAGYTQTGNGATLLEGGKILAPGRPIELEGGSLVGAGTIKADLHDTGATVAPASPSGTPGALRVEGTYTQGPGGRLTVRVDGPEAAAHDSVAVTGVAELGGALEAGTGGGYAPSVPTTIAGILSAPTVSGTFASFSSSGTPSGTAWEPAYRSSAVDLTLGAVPVQGGGSGEEAPRGGGGDGGGTASTPTPSSPTTPQPTAPKPLKCKKGFVKKKVKGKARCVKAKPRRHRRA
ncbi:MAG TPA: hypothetical protein VMF55_05380, partial [Solirubrobacterales bacterium]|nr:hypothetical protein [Solirubrobacterales bacterium]